MIVIVDTNAYHGDVEATRQDLTTLFDAVEEGRTDPEDAEIWTPRGVVEELVRQWPRRAERIDKVLGSIKRDLASFGLPRHAIPDFDDTAVAGYRHRLETRLSGVSRKIADHPASIGKAIDWAAQHRFPIKAKGQEKPSKGEADLTMFTQPKTAPITGVVHAAVWLTVAEAAATGDDVAVITNNSTDFVDPADATKPHPKLAEEVLAAGGDPSRVTVYPSVRAFNDKHVQQSAEAVAEQFLETNKQTVLNEISDASEWLPLDTETEWGLLVSVDEITLASFEPNALTLVRVDEAEDGFFMTVDAEGDGRLDLLLVEV